MRAKLPLEGESGGGGDDGDGDGDSGDSGDDGGSGGGGNDDDDDAAWANARVDSMSADGLVVLFEKSKRTARVKLADARAVAPLDGDWERELTPEARMARWAEEAYRASDDLGAWCAKGLRIVQASAADQLHAARARVLDEVTPRRDRAVTSCAEGWMATTLRNDESQPPGCSTSCARPPRATRERPSHSTPAGDGFDSYSQSVRGEILTAR